MGNWRTVHIHGTVSGMKVPALREALTPPSTGKWTEQDDALYCLHINSGVFRLGNWIPDDGLVNVVGNLSERDLGVGDVYDACCQIVNIDPAACFVIDIGDDFESSECIASIVVTNGQARIVSAIVEELPKNYMKG